MDCGRGVGSGASPARIGAGAVACRRPLSQTAPGQQATEDGTVSAVTPAPWEQTAARLRTAGSGQRLKTMAATPAAPGARSSTLSRANWGRAETMSELTLEVNIESVRPARTTGTAVEPYHLQDC